MPGKSVFEMSFADVYPALIRKAERNRSVCELDDEAAPGMCDIHSNTALFIEKQKPRRMAELLLLAKDCFFDKIGAIVRLEKQAA